MTRVIEVETPKTRRTKERQQFLDAYDESYMDFVLATGRRPAYAYELGKVFDRAKVKMAARR